MKVRLFGLVEHYFECASYEEIDAEFDRQLDRISLTLEEWLNWPTKPGQFLKW